MRKVDDGGKRRGGGNNEKIMSFIVDTNVVASQPLERRPTEALQARAKMNFDEIDLEGEHRTFGYPN